MMILVDSIAISVDTPKINSVFLGERVHKIDSYESLNGIIPN